MLRQPITYKDWDGKTQTRTFHFNISAAEMAEMEIMHDTGSYKEYLEGIVKRNNRGEIFQTFKDLLRFSVGRRVGDDFEKSETATRSFMLTGAYDEFLMEIMTDTNKAIAFFNGVFPRPEQVQATLEKYRPATEVPIAPPPPGVVSEAQAKYEAELGVKKLSPEATRRLSEEIFGTSAVGSVVPAELEFRPALMPDNRTFEDYTRDEIMAMSETEQKAMMDRTAARFSSTERL
jgi:hypothetical protein